MTVSEPFARSPTPDPSDLNIRVWNEGGAWLLECRPGFETVIFHSSQTAQAAGEAIATRFACAGQGVQMAVEDGVHAIMATRTVFPLSEAESKTDKINRGIVHRL